VKGAGLQREGASVGHVDQRTGVGVERAGQRSGDGVGRTVDGEQASASVWWTEDMYRHRAGCWLVDRHRRRVLWPKERRQALDEEEGGRGSRGGGRCLVRAWEGGGHRGRG
jgi:hypothetical protein